MLERQDIDALLVGALYGELSSAEQAQLTAHLESHPADRSALDDLKAVRERFTASRIFEIQAEPPQSISALLLQEAARRAPKQVVAPDKKESWFDRFVRSFIAHPAMAAAATLVLVLGVAGTIYLKGGDITQPRIGQDSETIAMNAGSAAPAEGAWGSATMGTAPNATPPTAVAAAPATPSEQGAAGAGDGKRDSVAVALADDKIAKTGVTSDLPADNRERDQLGFTDSNKQQVATHHAAAPAEVAKAPAKGRYVEVPKEEPQPKDLGGELQDSSGKDVVAKNDRAEATRGAGPGGGAATGNFAQAPVAQQQRPAASPPPPPPAPVVAGAAEPPPQRAAKPDANLAWAKDQHAKILALVKEGKCGAAVPLAATLKTRAPDYYATNVATDRALKSCMQYVNDSTTERAAEKKASKATDTR